MRGKDILIGFVCMLFSIAAPAADEALAEAAVDAVLTGLHQAASDGDGEAYFRLFAEDAIFMGTDATERWTVDDLLYIGTNQLCLPTAWDSLMVLSNSVQSFWRINAGSILC